MTSLLTAEVCPLPFELQLHGQQMQSLISREVLLMMTGRISPRSQI